MAVTRKPSHKGPWLRRVSVAWLAGTFLTANAVSAVFLIALADRHSVRFDVTATGEHRLAPQTRRLIEAVEPGAGFELVVAADVSRVDPRAWQALLDVGSELEAVGAMTVTTLEGESARAGLESLGQRLAAREAGEIQTQAQALLRAAAELVRAADVIDEAVVPRLTAAGATAGDANTDIRTVMEARAQTAPLLAQKLRDVAAEVQGQLQSAIMPGVNVPALD
ncbi:MAG: hypothetical protein ACIAQU_07445, partial [Phycisphaerales bacterium JB064]